MLAVCLDAQGSNDSSNSSSSNNRANSSSPTSKPIINVAVNEASGNDSRHSTAHKTVAYNDWAVAATWKGGNNNLVCFVIYSSADMVNDMAPLGVDYHVITGITVVIAQIPENWPGIVKRTVIFHYYPYTCNFC